MGFPQPGAQDFGVGVVQVVENGQGLPPRVVRGRLVVGGPVGVAEAGRRVGPGMAAAQLLKQDKGIPVARDGLLVLAEVVVASASPGRWPAAWNKA